MWSPCQDFTFRGSVNLLRDKKSEFARSAMERVAVWQAQGTLNCPACLLGHAWRGDCASELQRQERAAEGERRAVVLESVKTRAKAPSNGGLSKRPPTPTSSSTASTSSDYKQGEQTPSSSSRNMALWGERQKRGGSRSRPWLKCKGEEMVG